MSDGIDSARLMSFIERAERLAEEKKEASDLEKEIFAEAKAAGFEVKYLKRIIAERKKDPEERIAEEEMWLVYKRGANL